MKTARRDREMWGGRRAAFCFSLKLQCWVKSKAGPRAGLTKVGKCPPLSSVLWGQNNEAGGPGPGRTVPSGTVRCGDLGNCIPLSPHPWDLYERTTASLRSFWILVVLPRGLSLRFLRTSPSRHRGPPAPVPCTSAHRRHPRGCFHPVEGNALSGLSVLGAYIFFTRYGNCFLCLS